MAYSWTLKMEAIRSYETSAALHDVAFQYIVIFIHIFDLNMNGGVKV
jgi:hypothetical protein